MSAQGVDFFAQYFLIPLRSFEAHEVAGIYHKSEVIRHSLHRKGYGLQGKKTIFVDHVHAKRESPWEQPSETIGRHV